MMRLALPSALMLLAATELIEDDDMVKKFDHEAELELLRTSKLGNEDHYMELFRLVDKNNDDKTTVHEWYDFDHNMRHEKTVGEDADRFVQFWDSNSDGQITYQEALRAYMQGVDEAETHEEKREAEHWLAVQKAVFRKADENNDGTLNGREARHFAVIETTHPAVLHERAIHQHAYHDKNKDGEVTCQEYFHWGAFDLEGNPDPDWPERVKELCKEDDEDGDEKLSIKEIEHILNGHSKMRAHARLVFELADVNQDGIITKAEYKERLTMLSHMIVVNNYIDHFIHHKIIDVDGLSAEL